MKKEDLKRQLKRLGVVGFVLFTLKGILWLLIPLFVLKSC